MPSPRPKPRTNKDQSDEKDEIGDALVDLAEKKEKVDDFLENAKEVDARHPGNNRLSIAQRAFDKILNAFEQITDDYRAKLGQANSKRLAEIRQAHCSRVVGVGPDGKVDPATLSDYAKNYGGKAAAEEFLRSQGCQLEDNRER